MRRNHAAADLCFFVVRLTHEQAGKHVLEEKPMALSLADADAMIDACQQAGVKLGVVLFVKENENRD